jgi:hypothetical protein
MDVISLTKSIQDFVAEASTGVVIEDGQVIFDLAECRYTLDGEHGHCVLHFWSSERNCVRRVTDAEVKGSTLRLQVQRLGRPNPTLLQISRNPDQRTPSTKRSQRTAYECLLQRALLRTFPGFRADRPKSSMDLERSFGPVYARGILHKGNTLFAVLGVNGDELQASVDGALTIGLLWLDYLREREAARKHVAGIKLFVPPGRSQVVRERMAHLNHEAASFELYEFDHRAGTAEPVDTSDHGNISTRLVHCPNQQGAFQRFEASILKIRCLVPECDVVVITPAEISFRVHGLEFARARLGGSIHSTQEIVFGVGPAETVLGADCVDIFGEIVRRLRESRRAGPHKQDDVLWRLAPERWLESLIISDVSALDYRLDSRWVYSQVPAFAAADRAMIDVLCSTSNGRLAVLELKADEDLHLPLQGLDYWARVSWHHSRGEFQNFGYFSGAALSEKSPLLMLVAPALRIHPTTDKLLRYFSPQIDWELVAVNEDWREGLKTVFRKRAGVSVQTNS